MVDIEKQQQNVTQFTSDPAVLRPIADGALGDDEHDERAERKVNKPAVARTVRKGEPEVDDAENASGNVRKHHRRKKKAGKHHNNRKWKPYSKLSWDERKELEDRETKRATQKRRERFESGHPVAPYNTTQFLIEDHNLGEHIEPDLEKHEGDETGSRQNSRGDNSGSPESTDEFYESPDDEELFLAKDFSETYDNIHAERLQSMPKGDLVKEVLSMEAKYEKLEAKLKKLTGTNNVNNDDDVENSINNNINLLHMRSVESMDLDQNPTIVSQNKFPSKEEIERLKAENARLSKENENMRKLLQTHEIDDW